MAHLDALGTKHGRTSAASVAANLGGADAQPGRRDYSGAHYTDLHEPDGNMIALVHHPLGMEDARQQGAASPGGRPSLDAPPWPRRRPSVTHAVRRTAPDGSGGESHQKPVIISMRLEGSGTDPFVKKSNLSPIQPRVSCSVRGRLQTDHLLSQTRP